MLHRCDDIVIHTPHPYSGIMLVCPQCRHRCKNVSPIYRKVYEPHIFHCRICRVEWMIESLEDVW